MPSTYFEQTRRQAALAHAAGTPPARTPISALNITDPGWFITVFDLTFGPRATAIFDPLSADDHRALDVLDAAGRVTMHGGTMAIIDDGVTPVLARVRVDGQVYQLWEGIEDDILDLPARWYIEDVKSFDDDREPSPATAACIVPEGPTHALHSLVSVLARHQRGSFFLPAGEAFADLDPLTIAIEDAAAVEAAQPALAELTIAMIQGDLDATRAVLEATFGAVFAQPTLWTVQYQRGPAGVGEAVLTERSPDGAAAAPQYRLCVVSTPSSWRWLLKSLAGTRPSVDFATSDCPATMERRLLRALGALRGRP